MRHLWTREFLTRRIDRHYLVAAGSKRAEKRELHLELARIYRKALTAVLDCPSRTSAELRRLHSQAQAHLAGAAGRPMLATAE